MSESETTQLSWEIEPRLKRVVIDILNIEESRYAENANFIKDFAADSLDCVELVIAMEGEFQIECTEQEMDECETVTDALKLVRRKYK